MSLPAPSLADAPVLTRFPPPVSGVDAAICTTRCRRNADGMPTIKKVRK